MNSLKSVQVRALSYLQSPYVFSAVAIAAGLTLSAAVLASSHPAAGEIVQNTIISAGAFINLTLVALTLICVVAFAMWNFGRGISFEMPSAKNALLSAGWSEPDISPDILVVSRPGESKEDYCARVEAAIKNITPTTWVVIIEYQNPVAGLYTNGTGKDYFFSRDDAPFQADGFDAVAQKGTLFTYESPADFVKYINEFSRIFREWSAIKKVANDPGRAGRTVLEIVAPCLLPIFLFFAPGLFAQKAAQVSDALGTRIREIPEQGIRVEYEFEQATLFRDADGRKDYVSLLKAVPMYRDGGGGKLIAVYSGDRVVCRAPRVERTAEREQMRPYRATTAVTDEPVRYSMPDSLELAYSLDQARERVSFYESEFWRAIRPAWAFVMFCFWALFPFICVVGLVLWFWARLSASEEMPQLHWHSSRGLVILVGSAWTVLIINAMLTVVYWELPTVPFLMAVAAIGLFAWKTAAWIVPNLNAKPGGRTAYMSNRNTPLLGG